MTSPYLSPTVQKYDPGSQNKGQPAFYVAWVTTLQTGSESNAHIQSQRAAPLSGHGKRRDQRKVQNQGFSL